MWQTMLPSAKEVEATMNDREQINGETYASLLRQGASRGLPLQAGEVAMFPNCARRTMSRIAKASILIGGSLMIIGFLI